MLLKSKLVYICFIFTLFAPNKVLSASPIPSSCTNTIPGDANGDCAVDKLDYQIWLAHYGQTTVNCNFDGNFNCPTDTKINVIDFAMWRRSYIATHAASPSNTPTPPSGNGVWISLPELMSRPTSGSAWEAVHSDAGASWGSANVSNQDSNHDVLTYAGALVCVRTGQYCDKTKLALLSAIGTETGARWLAVGRNMTAYTIATDLLRAKGVLMGSDLTNVSNWLASFLTRQLANNNTGVPETLTPFKSGSNASAQEGAVYAAISVYTGDQVKLTYVWNRMRLYSCDRANNPEQVIDVQNGFDGGWSYTSDYNQACAVNPKDTTKQGVRIDGAIINDMVRGGSFQWPPGYTQYPWVGLEGYIPAALIFHRAGYPAFQISDQAVWRTHEYLWFLKNNTSTDWWDPSRAAEVKHLVNVAYGKNLPVTYPTGKGRTIGYTDWTHPNGL